MINRLPYRGASKSVAVEQPEGMVKVLFDPKTKEILVPISQVPMHGTIHVAFGQISRTAARRYSDHDSCPSHSFGSCNGIHARGGRLGNSHIIEL